MRMKLTDTIHPDYLQLGVQSGPYNEFRKTLWLAGVWAPKRAKSFSVLSFVQTDYYGIPADPCDGATGFARVRIAYYTTLKEGTFKVADYNDLGAEFYHHYNIRGGRNLFSPDALTSVPLIRG